MENPLNELEKLILKLNPAEFTLLSVLLGYILSEGLNSLQIQSIGNFMFSIGQTMSTIGTQRQYIDSKFEINSNDLKWMIDILKNKIGNIEKIITDLKNLN